MKITHNKTIAVMESGDLFVCDLSYPISVTADTKDIMGLYIPKGSRPIFEKRCGDFKNALISNRRMSTPLRCCLNFLSDQSRSSSELNALLDAIVDLLPIDVSGACNEFDNAGNGKFYQEIVSHIELRLGISSLSAKSLSATFEISERHLHRIFAKRGMRLGAVIQNLRLEGAAAELTRQRDRQITDLAFRWGFNDLSTFTRAFKKRFGRCPSKF